MTDDSIKTMIDAALERLRAAVVTKGVDPERLRIALQTLDSLRQEIERDQSWLGRLVRQGRLDQPSGALEVTMFTLTDCLTDRVVGCALICFAARYAATLGLDSGRLDRRLGPAETWDMIEVELQTGIGSDALTATSPIAVLLAIPLDIRIRYLSTRPFEAPADNLVGSLDELLRSLCVEHSRIDQDGIAG